MCRRLARAKVSAMTSIAEREVRQAVGWYFSRNVVKSDRPFYCDAKRVGSFAVEPARLATGDDETLFRMFIAMSMYQARRDVLVMRHQTSMSRTQVQVIADSRFLERSVERAECNALQAGRAFADTCNVKMNRAGVDCATHPGARCHVKQATVVFKRMGDMGKLPTDAWLFFGKLGARELLATVCRTESSTVKRADLLVERLARVHRVGRKLATMFVSALSVPALAPGVTPWHPEVDGNELLVIDTNVAKAVDRLNRQGTLKTYEARARWLRRAASHINLREFRADLPEFSPRLVQEALYAFGSRSNRIAHMDPCSRAATMCADCAPTICPFEGSRR